MAYVIGTKVVKDTVEFNDYAYGITLPVQLGSTGYFEQAFTSYEQARANLINLLKTSKGERVMQPNFGSGLQELLFEQITNDFETNIETVITESVAFWLPYITIVDIEIDISDENKDNNKAELKIGFTVGKDISRQEITFTIQG